jgi:plasmid stability protein
MTQLVVPDVEDDVRDRLQDLARKHGRSIEQEAREILRAAVATPAASGRRGLGSRIVSRFAGIGLEGGVPEIRSQMPRPADLDP